MDTLRSQATLSPELKEPIRAEIFGVERLEQHAESLAAAQIVNGDLRRGRLLTPRVLENGRVLVESYRTIARAIREERTITPAAEWLVDNFHIVDEQLREIIDDLPPGYYRQLPKLASGHLENYPILGYVVAGATLITIIMMYFINQMVMKKLASTPAPVPAVEV